MTFKQINFTLFCSIIFILPVFAEQMEYQTEISLGHFDVEDDDNATLDVDALGLEYFFQPIKPQPNQPLAEAAFLNRASSVSFILLQKDENSVNHTAKTDAYALGFDYAQPDSPFVISGFYLDEDNELVLNGSPGKLTSDTTGLLLGYFIAQHTAIGLSYSKENFKSAQFTLNYDSIEELGLELKNVSLNPNGTAWSLEGGISKKDYSTVGNNTILELLGNYYLNPGLSIGVTYENTSGDVKCATGHTYVLNARLFITPVISLSAELATFNAADKPTGDDEDAWSIQAAIRF